ncbi:MAG: glycerol kinase GlpK [Eubacteriales bacterium]
MKKYIVSLDQGTTSSRTIIFDKSGNIVSMAREEIKQIYPSAGWVEHDPMEILSSQLSTLNKAIKDAKIDIREIASIGVTNQRETTVVWDKCSGKPIYNAIVWQCRRTTSYCEALKEKGLEDYVRSTTGLIIDAYFSGTKIKWILDNVSGARDRAKEGALLFGTIDTWLIWNLTKGKVHATDYSNASRTMLFDINHLVWDELLTNEMNIPRDILPEVRNSSGSFGEMEIDGVKIPITGVAGDQQAALFGQECFDKGAVKNTYGTGCFMLMNTGDKPVASKSGLLTTIAWGIGGQINYALEGSVFVGGAVIQWLRDELKLIKSSEESEAIATSIKSSDGVYIVPAFVGLGAPFWDMNCRGIITGLSRGTGRDQIVRAALESIAYQVKSIIETIENDEGIWIKDFKVDGGASANNFLMQFQADILNVKVERPKMIESTALGAAYFSGLYSGFWKDLEEIKNNSEIDQIFVPAMQEKERIFLFSGWKNAVKKATNFND